METAQKMLVFLVLVILIIVNGLWLTNHSGLSVVVTRNYATPKATQTLGNLEVFNWWGHTVFEARTIEVPPSSNRLLHPGTFSLYKMKDGPRDTYGIYETMFENSFKKKGFQFISKGKLYRIKVVHSVRETGGSIGIGESIKVLPQGAILMEKGAEAVKEFTEVLSSSANVKLFIRDFNDTTPKWEFHPLSLFLRLIKG